MNCTNSTFVALLSCGLFAPAVLAAPSSDVTAKDKPTGRQALNAVRHDWKVHASSTVHLKQSNPDRIPANFGSLSPEARLAYLHARRNLNPTRFDRFHPHIGPMLARDDRLRMAQSQDCRPLSGLLPDTRLTRYLHYRRNLNPARFDRYHPTQGAFLAEDDLLRSGKGCVSPEIIPPPVVVTPPAGTPSSGPPFGGGPIPPRSVPEPGSLALIVLGALGVLTPKLLRRWHPRPADD
ncbi:MAG: hypothetical protein JWN86_2479 [Planctomycetota bacterium]|nr:hypothetical protein [Planctomycetota bacterium]